MAIIMRSLILFFLFLPRIVFSEELKKLKPEEFARRALQRSDQINAEKVKKIAYKFFKQQSQRYQNPQISLNYGKRTIGSENGPQYQVTVTQPFLFPGKRELKAKIAQKSEEIADQNLNQKQLDIYYITLHSVFRYYIARLREEHARERMRRFQVLDRFFRSRPFPSPSRKLQAMLVRSRLKILKSELIGIRSERKVFWQKLNLFTEFQQEILPDVTLFKNPGQPNYELLLAQSLHNSPDLLKSKLQMEKSKLTSKYLQRKNYPNMAVSGFYGGQDAGDKERSYGLGISMPISILNRNKAAIQGNEMLAKSEKATYQFKRKKIINEFKILKVYYQTSIDKINYLPPSVVDKAHDQLTYAERTFRRGLISFRDFMDAEQAHDDLHESVLNVHREHAHYKILLHQYTGKMYSIFSSNSKEFQP